MIRIDGRKPDELRNIQIIRHFTKHAEGSVLVCYGDTKVICTASVEERVPSFKKGSGEGWVTAEYDMLPRATTQRNNRDRSSLRVSPRSNEIQRLIGRSLRAVVDFKRLGERTITIDCDVIQADGGTRTAAVTGSFVAMMDAMGKLVTEGLITEIPVNDFVAAVSVGLVADNTLLDLCYAEDSNATVDMNVVMTSDLSMIELQATGEKAPFSRETLNELMALAEKGCKELFQLQRDALIQ